MNNENSTNDPHEPRPFGGQDGSSYQASGDAMNGAGHTPPGEGSPGSAEGGANATENIYRINYGQAPAPNTSRFPSTAFGEQPTSQYPSEGNYPGSNGTQAPSSGTPFYGEYPGAPAGGYAASSQYAASHQAESSHPESAAGQFQNGYAAYPGPWANPANGGTIPPMGGLPGQKSHRQKRRWSTALLGITAAFSMLLGGVIGTQIDTFFGSESSPTQTQESQPRQIPQSPQVDPGNGQNGQSVPGQQASPSSGLDAGTVVDSAPGVVLVNTHLYYGAGAGTGMIISSDGLMLTNYHVVSGSEDVQITVSDTGKTYTAHVLGHDATHDIALLQIDDAKDLETVTTNTKKLQIGDEVSAVGNGSGQGYLTQLDGSVLALGETITATDAASPTDGEVLTDLIVTDADVVPGYSGGPLFNSDGEVVGITTAASRGTTSDQVNGYAVPISTALDIADQIKSGKPSDTVRIGKNPALGVTVANGTTSGARIVEVLEGSAAAQAGIVADDTVTALDGTPITTSSMLSELVKEHEVGDVVTLTVVGVDGTQREVQVTLAESTVN